MNLDLFISSAQVVFVGGTIIPLLTQVLKKITKRDPRHIAVGLSSVLAILFVLLNEFVPAELLQYMVAIASSTWLLANTLYRSYSSDSKE